MYLSEKRRLSSSLSSGGIDDPHSAAQFPLNTEICSIINIISLSLVMARDDLPSDAALGADDLVTVTVTLTPHSLLLTPGAGVAVYLNAAPHVNHPVPSNYFQCYRLFHTR